MAKQNSVSFSYQKTVVAKSHYRTETETPSLALWICEFHHQSYF